MNLRHNLPSIAGSAGIASRIDRARREAPSSSGGRADRPNLSLGYANPSSQMVSSVSVNKEEIIN